MLECSGQFFLSNQQKLKSLWLSWKTILKNYVDGVPIKNIIVLFKFKQLGVTPEICFTKCAVDINLICTR